MKCLSNECRIVLECRHDLPNHYSNIVLDEFVVMPNHVHGIIVIQNVVAVQKVGRESRRVGTTRCIENLDLSPFIRFANNPICSFWTASTEKHYSLSEIVRGFKTFSARKINDINNSPETPFWQPRFHDGCKKRSDTSTVATSSMHSRRYQAALLCHRLPPR